jgi:hypothetical protein
VVRVPLPKHHEVYSLTLIQCRKDNWLHAGSNPATSTKVKNEFMKFINYIVYGQSIAEFTGENITLSTTQQFLQMIMDSSAEGVILHKENIDESFFDLRSGLAGDMLQKVVNYRLRLAIVGDFSVYESKSLKAFINESNKTNTIVFVSTVEDALKRLSF